jgi:hypothetical protein
VSAGLWCVAALAWLLGGWVFIAAVGEDDHAGQALIVVIWPVLLAALAAWVVLTLPFRVAEWREK